MLLHGYCNVQKCEYAISIRVIPAPTLENPKGIEYGTINCEYARFSNKCRGNKCSILEQNGISR